MWKNRKCRLSIERLESRLAFAIELDLVALHEFGHALGLAHYPDTPANSIMEAYYNASYDKASLATDVAVTANASDGYSNLLELYTPTKVASNTTSWKNNLDPNPSNGTVDVTVSFVPDGTKLDSNKTSNLFKTMRSKVSADDATWQALFKEELQRWASVSGGLLNFVFRTTDSGANSGTGLIQNDPNFGDIRIGGHRFDGAGGTLAHAYYPPGTNNNSLAGDAHFASEETWINGDPLMASSTSSGRFAQLVHTAEGDFYKCTYDEHDEHDHEDELYANPIFQQLMNAWLNHDANESEDAASNDDANAISLAATAIPGASSGSASILENRRPSAVDHSSISTAQAITAFPVAGVTWKATEVSNGSVSKRSRNNLSDHSKIGLEDTSKVFGLKADEVDRWFANAATI